MIEHDTFEEWLKGRRIELQYCIDGGGVGELPYIKLLAQALAVQEVLNAWNFYQSQDAPRAMKKGASPPDQED